MLNAQDRRTDHRRAPGRDRRRRPQVAPGGAEPARPHARRGWRRQDDLLSGGRPTGEGAGQEAQAERHRSDLRPRRSPRSRPRPWSTRTGLRTSPRSSRTSRAQLNTLDEGKLRPETIRTKLPDGTTEAVATARLDLLNLLGKVLGEDTYGGLIEVDAPDLESALRRFDVEQHLVARWQGDRIGEFLDHLADDEAGVALGAVLRRVRRGPRRRCCRGCGPSPSSRWQSRRTRRLAACC